jgi:hypothetical protein
MERWNGAVGDSVPRSLGRRRFAVAGLGVPEHARDITAEMVLAWKNDPVVPGRHGDCRPMKQPSAFQALSMLRVIPRMGREPHRRPRTSVARKEGRCDKPPVVRRSYVGPLVHRRDLRPPPARLGGSRLGGAPTERAVDPQARGCQSLERPTLDRRDSERWLAARAPRCAGRRERPPAIRARSTGAGRVYPGCYQLIYDDVKSLGAPLVLRVAPHDLQRTFGRVLYYEKGVDINEIRSLYGHATTEQTLYYIGAVPDRMRAPVQLSDGPPPTLATTVPGGA